MGEIRGDLFCYLFNEFVVDSCHVQLDGQQVSPATDSGAFGNGYFDVLFNELTGDTSGHLFLEHDVDNVTAIHIHRGKPRTNGEILFELEVGADGSPIEMRFDAEQLERFEEARLGGVYIDVHSTSHPNGEIRGAFQCPTGDDDDGGDEGEEGEERDLGRIASNLLDRFEELDADGNGALSLDELADSPITAAIFNALDDEADGGLTERELLLALGIETDIYLGGCEVFLSGDQEIPANDSEADGWGFIDLLSDAFSGEQRARVYIEHNVEDATGAHLHIGSDDENGAVVVDLGDAASPIEVVLRGEHLRAFLEAKPSGVYVNIHSPEFPDGEIRGQLDCFLFDDDILLTECDFDLKGANIVPQNNSTAMGEGRLEVRYSALVGARTGRILVEHDVDNPTAAFVYTGGPGQSGSVLFELGNPTSPIEVELDEAKIEALFGALEAGIYVNVHSTAFPSGEIRGQLECVEVEHPEGDFEELASDLLELFISLDFDEDGGLSLAEIQEFDPGFTEEVFHELDTNGDGVLDEDELIAALNFDQEVFIGGCTSDLAGARELPPNASRARGSAFFNILSNPLTGELKAEIFIEHSVSNATGAHIHAGGPDRNGDVIFDLGDATSPIEVEVEGDDLEELLALLEGGAYFNIHSASFPDGEIRGQLDCFFFDEALVSSCATGLSGGQANPPNESNASGFAYLDVFENQFTGAIHAKLFVEHDVEGVSAAHIHRGGPEENGPVVINLGNPASPIEIDLTPEDLDILFDGGEGMDFYINIHSANFPGGEIRGQLNCEGRGVPGSGPPRLGAIADALYPDFDDLDADMNGALSLEEAQAAIAMLLGEDFELLDLNGDGEVDLVELETILGIGIGDLVLGCDTFLDGGQFMEPVETDAEGFVYLDILRESDGIGLDAFFYAEHTVQNPTGAAIHVGFPGTDGEALIDLGDGVSPIELTLSTEALLLLGEYRGFGLYVQVNSDAHPEGEIRGQLNCFSPNEPSPVVCDTFLSGFDVVPPTDNDFGGLGLFTVFDGTEEDGVRIHIVHDVPDALTATLHVAGPGEIGEVEIDLGTATSPIRVGFGPDDAALFLDSDGIYVEINSADPEATIRGDLMCFVPGEPITIP
jgi:Ca2+-binding EF-hand superfamily protein